MVGGDPYCCELLLHEHAVIGSTDENGWQEIHQACRHGNVQHLEHLLFYGADMSSQNASGNTALHLCGLYNQVTLHLCGLYNQVTLHLCGLYNQVTLHLCGLYNQVTLHLCGLYNQVTLHLWSIQPGNTTPV
ncbi:SH3 and multiple ankyrin repeat domains protein 2-like [Oncorhynchus keta]|uniref:SH3 and multiple ankyrin repeat domains protein 2-like n=1 Tax=Oncorhynchus keta TaxID=8018 RepID=UPI00227A4A5D|nr:SH3 and multiple ankyrin repeat domains protein 2-like [Oncorhynchus keta]